jgi:RNA polymerase sigma factor (sigma-70 family)
MDTSAQTTVLEDKSDETVINEIKNGNTDLFRVIIKRYNQRLYRIAVSFNIDDDNCDDILQQTYICAYEKLHQFKGEAKFSTWLTKILINECLMLKRSNKSIMRKKAALENVTSSFAEHQTPEDDFMRSELNKTLENAIRDLPEKYRQVFILREVEGLNVKETADVLGITETNVKIRAHRGKALLQRKLSQNFNYNEVFTFGNKRCDNIADNVMNLIKNEKENQNKKSL